MKKLIFTGMKRRRKEIQYVSLVTFFAVVFMTGITLLQDIMDDYLYHNNLNTYGNWIVATVDRTLQHPYFLLKSNVKTGANIIDEKGIATDIWVGMADENFDLIDGQAFYEGRMPQNDSEIAMDISALSFLGYSYDVGQTITFSYWGENGLSTKAYELVGVLKSVNQIWQTAFDYPIPNIFLTEQELKESNNNEENHNNEIINLWNTQSDEEKISNFSDTQANNKETDSLTDTQVNNDEESNLSENQNNKEEDISYPILNRNISSYTTTFYQLNPEYKTIDARAFANSFESKEGEEQIVLTFNSYVYENGIWDSAVVFERISHAFMIVSALAMGYLLIAYIGKRRSVYYKYRTLGATKGQVRGIILLECVYATLPQIVLGIGIIYLIAGFSCSLISIQQNIPSFYSFNVKLFVEHLVVSIGVVAISIFGAMLSINEKSLVGNMQTIKPSQYHRIRKIALRTKSPELAIFQRQRKIKPLQSICQAIFSMMVCGCLLFCVFKIEDSIAITKGVLEVQPDFELSERTKLYSYQKKENGEIIDGSSFGTTMLDMYNGAPEHILQEILLCPGVKELEYARVDERHYFTWENMKDSTLIKWLEKKGETDEPIIYGMGTQFYDDISMLQKEVEPLQKELEIMDREIDWEMVEKGNSVIVLCDSFNDGYRAEIVKEDVLRVDDEIVIRDFKNQIEVPVKVAAVFDCTEIEHYTMEHATAYWRFDNYTILATTSLAEKIAEAEGKELTISYIQVQYDATASYVSTDKQLANIAKTYHLDYHSNAEVRRMYQRQLIMDIGIYGSIFFMLLCVYILIQSNILVTKENYWKKQYTILKQIGMENVQYEQLSFVEECKNYLWLMGGLIFGNLLMYQSYYEECKDTPLVNTETGEILKEGAELALQDWIEQTPHILLIGTVIVIYVFMLLCSKRMIHKAVKGGIEK